jgi:hypothetical protein
MALWCKLLPQRPKWCLNLMPCEAADYEHSYVQASALAHFPALSSVTYPSEAFQIPCDVLPDAGYCCCSNSGVPDA